MWIACPLGPQLGQTVVARLRPDRSLEGLKYPMEPVRVGPGANGRVLCSCFSSLPTSGRGFGAWRWLVARRMATAVGSVFRRQPGTQ